MSFLDPNRTEKEKVASGPNRYSSGNKGRRREDEEVAVVEGVR